MQWRRNLWFLSIAVFIANLSFTLNMPFLPRFLEELGLEKNLSLWSGIMISVNFVTYAIMAPIWGSLADLHGKRVMFMRSGFGIAVTYVFMGLAANHWQLFIFRAMNGLLSGFIPSAIMFVATNTPEEDMGYALGILNTFIALGGIMGPFMGGAMVQYLGLRMIFYISAGLLFIASALAVFGTKERIIKQAVKVNLWQDLKSIMANRSLKVYFFCMVMLQGATYMIQPILPIRIAELTRGNVELITGIIFSVIGISLAIGSPLVCKIKKANYVTILLGGLLLCALLSVVQGLTYSVLLLGVQRFLFGFANAAVNVSGNVLITQCAGEEMRGRVFGTLNGLTAFGAVFGPLMGGFLGEHLGTPSAFHGSAVLFVLAGYAVWKIRHKAVDVLKSRVETCSCLE
ncbi:MFS transporter [Thermanaerosceptrum fracticalcis]|uniref:MFS transporter n=1 Tax=Thermanaerosceptrum fracticalcis TaxID=1712410 RepID=UPI000551E492|nr:MFS transporter [Thermanaerosceptrum fracticalcis]